MRLWRVAALRRAASAQWCPINAVREGLRRPMRPRRGSAIPMPVRRRPIGGRVGPRAIPAAAAGRPLLGLDRAGRGREIIDATLSGFIGAAIMVLVAHAVEHIRTAPPAHVMFLPAFWLLVPGTLGLIGITELVGKDPQHSPISFSPRGDPGGASAQPACSGALASQRRVDPRPRGRRTARVRWASVPFNRSVGTEGGAALIWVGDERTVRGPCISWFRRPPVSLFAGLCEEA